MIMRLIKGTTTRKLHDLSWENIYIQKIKNVFKRIPTQTPIQIINFETKMLWNKFKQTIKDYK